MSQPSDNYYLYPQIMDVKEAKPSNDPFIELYHKPIHVCVQANENSTQELVVLIKSCADCFEDRNHMRETYMQKKLWNDFCIQFAFVTGLPIETSTEPLFIENVRMHPQERGSRTKDDAESLTYQLFEEAFTYDDILVGNFADTYYNLTLKQMFTFLWVSVFCRYQAPIYLFIDNDYSIVPANLTKLIRRIPTAFKPRMNAGIRGPDLKVRRPKLRDGVQADGISDSEVPWETYPEYSSGACYFIGADLLIDVTIATAFTKRFRFEDAYLSFVWTKLNQRVYAFPEFKHGIEPNTNISRLAVAPKILLDQQMNWQTSVPNLTINAEPNGSS